ncbi:hypothetical protein H8B02_20880 [Bradyrhizobium sp. Pear77]|uniref:ABC transporter permease n=1 Tax=Bradyrhizobium altum TaxID=1571202 RepID=UPI001E62056A|nr:hypothetical protein [Bradyrhizobium altum]MCC8955794.1 hypothetical protein [Bradyrhizobium altum]
MSASLARIDHGLEHTPLSIDATEGGTLWHITADPAGHPRRALFAFITSLDEVVALFLSRSDAVMLPRHIWDDLRFQLELAIGAVSTLKIFLTALLLAATRYLRKRAEQLRDEQ